ncbi:type IX secretion system PorP/SprF family membrane protein [Pontibacter ummariensis]|uniref:Type IX secretion system membrane protein, PorP/SprF family n=2 Tax=Pontibacter ummariensis TaxID=1610492 RepID=A0A239CYG7_9BACT|nr:type IX secretion system PorP/SprF family membrane protein [Pontibacter ummariensis]SNS24808.1 type IX secretion system membrane protein, PorP/SprF family [Pontibacter ummariensis]
MNKMKIYYLLLALLLTTAASAQQNPQYSQYIFNSTSINPAYTGSKNVLNLNAFYRSQWTGVEGAPETQALTVDGLVANDRLGAGLTLTRDEIGAQSVTSAYANIAVKLQVSQNAILSLGIAPGLVQHVVDGSKFGIQDDPSIPTGKQTDLKPDVKIGAYLHTSRFYAGVSASDLIQYKDMDQVEPERHYYFTSGYVFDVSPFVKFKPSVLVKEDFHAPTSVDLNGFLLLGERLWLGSSYRTSMNVFNNPEGETLSKKTAVAFIAELQVLKELRVGYSFDKMLNGFSDYNTHEVSVGYYFFKKKDTSMLTPQYF